VYIPASLTRQGATAPYALVERKVLRQADKGRSIFIDDGDGESMKVATRRVQPGSLGFALIRIGDFQTENTLLDPLAKSVLQYLRLMLPDHVVTNVSIRTLHELQEWWAFNSAAQTHCILVGHGEPEGLKFLDHENLVSGTHLGSALTEAAALASTPKAFLSLSCLSGRAGFANGFSATRICRAFIGPHQSVHGASASQYIQTLLAHHLLDGTELLAAHRRANKSTSKGTSFRFFRSGGWLPDNLAR
jgi:hypothetical protein